MIKHTTYINTLESDQFGEESFEYDSLGEAMAGMERLIKSASKHTTKDHVKRCVSMAIVNTITSAFA